MADQSLTDKAPHQPSLTDTACGKSLGTHGFVEKFCELKKGHDGDCGFLGGTSKKANDKPAA